MRNSRIGIISIKVCIRSNKIGVIRTKIVTVGLTILTLSFILSGVARARFGVIAIVLFVAGDIFTVSSLSAKGYGEDASIPVLLIIVPLLITLWALVSCATGWNEKSPETT